MSVNAIGYHQTWFTPAGIHLKSVELPTYVHRAAFTHATRNKTELLGAKMKHRKAVMR
jgi:hypothetical protein